MYNTNTMKSFTYIIAALLMLTVMATAVKAAEEVYYNFGDSSIGEIRREIKSLLDDNKILEKEYKRLRDEMYDLQISIDQAKSGLIREQEASEIARNQRRSNKEEIAGLGDNIDQLKNDILIKKSKRAFLKGQLLDLNKKFELWKLRLADMEYELRQLNLERRKKEHELKQNNLTKDDVYRELKKDLAQEEARRQELLNKIDEINKLSMSFSDEIIQLNDENFQMQQKVDRLSLNNEIKARELSILENRQKLADLKIDREYQVYEQEFEELNEEVQRLEQEYMTLNDNIENSLSQRDEKRKLMKNIIELDKENQDLMSKILKFQTDSEEN